MACCNAMVCSCTDQFSSCHFAAAAHFFSKLSLPFLLPLSFPFLLFFFLSLLFFLLSFIKFVPPTIWDICHIFIGCRRRAWGTVEWLRIRSGKERYSYGSSHWIWRCLFACWWTSGLLDAFGCNRTKVYNQ